MKNKTIKNNYIAKHMNTYNKSSVHTDRKKEGTPSGEDVNNGIQDFLDSYDRYQEKVLGNIWKECKEIAKKHPIIPPPELVKEIEELGKVKHPTLEQRLTIESIDFQKGIKFLD